MEETDTYLLVKLSNTPPSYAVTGLDVNSRLCEPCDPVLKPYIGKSIRELREESGYHAFHQWKKNPTG